MSDFDSIPERRPPGKGSKVLGAILILVSTICVGIILQNRFISDAPQRRVQRPNQTKSQDTAVPAHLQIYAETTAMPTGVAAPTAIVCDAAGNIIVGGDSLEALRPDGTTITKVGGLSRKIRCLAIDADRLYAGCGNQIVIFTWTGSKLKQVDEWNVLGESAVLTSIAAGDSQVWVADFGNRTVWRFSEDGKLLGQVQSPSPGGFILPSPHFDVAVGPQNEVWISNPGHHRIEIYNQAGKMERAVGRAGMGWPEFAGCCNPVDFAVRQDSFFVTAEKGLVRIKTYRPDGSLQSVVAGPDTFAEDTDSLDLAVDPTGRILALDIKAARVRVFIRRVLDTEEKSNAQ